MSGHNVYCQVNIHAFLKLEEKYIDKGEDGDINTNEDGTNLECLVPCCYCCCYYYHYYY